MTTQTEASGDSRAAGFLASIAVTLLSWAFVVWLAGVALYHGYGVSVPFRPSFILVFAVATAVKILAMTVAHAFQDAAVTAAPKRAAAQVIGAATAQQAMGNPSIADLMAKLTAE
jgi:hypothetical protein